VFNGLHLRIVKIAALWFFGPWLCFSAFGQPVADPTRPASLAVGNTSADISQPLKWKLTSTLIGPQRRVAIINDKIVQIGQKIDGAELVAVDAGSVMIRYSGKKIQLKLIAGTVKQAVKPAP
jgi:MSHA biogenesis protein MshK